MQSSIYRPTILWLLIIRIQCENLYSVYFNTYKDCCFHSPNNSYVLCSDRLSKHCDWRLILHVRIKVKRYKDDSIHGNTTVCFAIHRYINRTNRVNFASTFHEKWTPQKLTLPFNCRRIFFRFLWLPLDGIKNFTWDCSRRNVCELFIAN